MNDLFTAYKKQPNKCPFCEGTLDKIPQKERGANVITVNVNCSQGCGIWDEIFILKLIDNFKPTKKGKSLINKIEKEKLAAEEDAHASKFGGTS